MTFTTVTKPTDCILSGKFNATALNRQVRIRYWQKNTDGTYKASRLISARQLFELLGEELSADILARFHKYMGDKDFARKYRKIGMIQFNWR